jgi:polyferredoxin
MFISGGSDRRMKVYWIFIVPFFVLIAASMVYGILYPLFANGQSTSEAIVWGTLLIVAAILLLLARKNPHYIGIERK